MTMLVATLGLLPAAMSHGIGSDSQRPFAIVIVGGLSVTLVLTLQCRVNQSIHPQLCLAPCA
jgi:cobalt-zinc-cadmium resistance protein CzcA